MRKQYIAIVCIISVLCLFATSVCYAEEKQTVLMRIKKFWRGLFNYSANVTEKSADVITDTGKKGAKVVTDEVKRVGEVTSGDVSKTKELVVEPLTGTAETAKEAVEGTIKIPAEAAGKTSKD